MWRCVSAVLLSLTVLPAAAATLSLDTWLHQQAAPKLAEVLAEHPKFKGARIRFVGVRHSQPAPIDNELSAEIRQVLTHRVLRRGANDVVGPSVGRHCRSALAAEPYLVGIEVRADGRSRHYVSLTVMDAEEGVWVAGVSLNWRGRLNSDQSRAFNTSVSSGPAGSPDRPLALADRSQIVAGLLEQMRCTLPNGVEGTVALHTADQNLQLIAAGLAQQLALQSGFVLTSESAAADWQLTLTISETAQPRRLLAALAPSDERSASQRLAALVVRSAGTSHAPVAATPPSASTSPTLLLGKLAFSEGVDCSDRACVEVSFALDKPAYLLVFRTHGGGVTPISCTGKPQQRTAGELRYRVNLPAVGAARTGFYVVASRERAAIEQLDKLIRQASPHCRSRGVTASDWRQQLALTADELDARLQWRALHLHVDPQTHSVRSL